MKTFISFFLRRTTGVGLMAFCMGLLCAVPAKAGVDDGLFLEILELFAKGTGMLSGDSASNAGSAIGAAACWYCPAFELIFDVINVLATGVANKLSGLFLILLGVGTLFFLLFRIGKMLAGLQEVDLMQFLADIFKYLGRVMVASVLLTFSLSIFYHLISPVLQGTLTLGNIIYTQGATADMKIVQLTREASNGQVDLTVKCSESAERADEQAGSDDKAFSPGVKEALLCNMRQVASSLVSGMASGVFTFFYGQTAGPLYLISPLVMLQGLILFLIFFLIFISYPFKLLDALFQLAFVSALAPLWIVLWAFPATAGYAKKAWEIFFGACLTFFMVNILAGLVLTILDMYAFPDSFWTDLIDGDMEGVLNQFPLGGLEFLTLTAMGILCLKILGTGKNLSSAFGGVSLDLGINQSAPQVSVSAVSTGTNATRNMGRLGTVTLGGLSKMGEMVGKAAKMNQFNEKKGQSHLSGWVPKSGGEHITGRVEKLTPEEMYVDYTSDNGQRWQNIYDEHGLKEFHKIHNTYEDGHAKTVDVHDSYGHLIGQRIYDEKNHDNWVQKNTDGSQTTHSVTRMQDGSVVEETQTQDIEGALISRTQIKTVQETDENGLDITRKETIYSDLLTGVDRTVTEIGETDENGVYRVFDRETDGKKESFTYDGAGHLQTRRTYDEGGQLQTTRYYTDSGVKADGSYTFGFRDYTVDAEGKAVQTGKPTLYYVKGRGK